VGRVVYRHKKRPRRVTSCATGRVMVTSCMTSEVTARSLEKGPCAGQRALSARPWRTRVARSWRWKLSSSSRPVTTDCRTARQVVPLRHYNSTVMRVPNRSTGLRRATLLTTPHCRPAEMSVTMKGGLLATRPEDNGPTTRNGISDTDGLTDG
jgi:hypothetical protein